MKVSAALVGVGASRFGRGLRNTQLAMAATAFKEALDDSGLRRDEIDRLSIHMGWPLGLDYDVVAEAFGLSIRYVNQAWTHGRFVTNALQHAALAVSACTRANSNPVFSTVIVCTIALVGPSPRKQSTNAVILLTSNSKQFRLNSSGGFPDR